MDFFYSRLALARVKSKMWQAQAVTCVKRYPRHQWETLCCYQLAPLIIMESNGHKLNVADMKFTQMFFSVEKKDTVKMHHLNKEPLAYNNQHVNWHILPEAF